MNAQVDISDIRIETERLILRPWREEDLADFYEYARVDGVGQMAGWMPHESIEKSRQVLDQFIGEKKTFALELKENHKVIGSLGLEEAERAGLDMGQLKGREVGYVLSKDYWGQGLMPEAVKAVIQYCFEKLNFDFLLCCHYLSNHQSRRVIEKCGFTWHCEIDHQTRMGTVERVRMYIRYSDRLITGPFDAAKTHIETERLVLRPLGEGDLADLFEIVSDPEIADQTGFTCKHTLEEARTYLEQNIQRNTELAVVLKETGEMVGCFSLESRYWEQYPISPAWVGRECGFELKRAHWGKGLMPEALRAVTAYCFDTLDYDFVTAGHFLRNGRSGHMIEKCGYQFLFEDDFNLPSGKKERIRTYIRRNPHKEVPNV